VQFQQAMLFIKVVANEVLVLSFPAQVVQQGLGKEGETGEETTGARECKGDCGRLCFLRAFPFTSLI